MSSRVLSRLLQVMLRLRVGIGRPTGRTSVERHVLSRFSSEEQKVLDSVVAQSVDLLLSQLSQQDPQQDSQCPSSPAGGRGAAPERKEKERSASPAAQSSWTQLREKIFTETVFILCSELNKLKETHVSTERLKMIQEQKKNLKKRPEVHDEWTPLPPQAATNWLINCVNLFIKDHVLYRMSKTKKVLITTINEVVFLLWCVWLLLRLTPQKPKNRFQ